ncbi:MAG: RNA methyltransferase [Chloroflexota bacterium]
MIQSVQNQQVKYLKKLKANRKFRFSEGLFLIEGNNWLREVVGFPHLLQSIYVTEDWLSQPLNVVLLENIHRQHTVVSNAVMKAISDTSSPPGVVGVVSHLSLPLPKKPIFLLVLDNISDPGNAGTLFRTAAAAGIEGILLSPNCVDPYNPKVIRSCVGTLFKLPILQKSWSEIETLTKDIPIYGLDANADLYYTAVSWQQPACLMVGNESKGLSPEGRAILANAISIPMANQVESLNASMAAGIVMFEAVRQKKQ